MRKERLIIKQSGFSVVEVLLAGTIVAFLVVTLVGALIYGVGSTALAGSLIRGTFLADEGLEAARNIRDNNFNNLTIGQHGLAISAAQWIFSGISDLTDIFTRQLNIIWSGLGTGVKVVTSTLSWSETAQRNISSILTTYLTDWRGCRGGVLVYGNGGTTTDAIAYKILDSVTCTWGSALSAADVDTGSTNRALRAVRIYSSKTRDEKVMISRHYDGTNQYIYAQVYSGVTGSASWSNVQLLSSWAAKTFLDVQNFDGTYLNDGTFMVVFSDNTTIPKMRTWNGSSWSAQTSLTNLGNNPHIPNFIKLASRSGTDEAMAAFFDQTKSTITQYWNGSAWSAITTHSTNSFQNTIRGMAFAWSPRSPTIGALIYMTGGGDHNIHGKLFQADGLGSGTWGAQTNSANQPNVVKLLRLGERSTADEFEACDKDSSPNATITCFTTTFVGTTMTWITPTNSLISSASQNGIQATFDIDYESVSGDPAISVFSDNTATPKFKKYSASTTTWDAAATSLNTLGGITETVNIIPYPFTDEIMILMADANLNLYSIVWDGANSVVYTTPSGYAFTTHGTNGSAITDQWYDFAWDQF